LLDQRNRRWGVDVLEWVHSAEPIDACLATGLPRHRQDRRHQAEVVRRGLTGDSTSMSVRSSDISISGSGTC
jgi:hypothetical protein